MGELETRLKTLIMEKYGSLNKFCEKIDMPWTTLDSILKRGIAKSNITNVLKITSELSIDTESLVAGAIIPTRPATIAAKRAPIEDLGTKVFGEDEPDTQKETHPMGLNDIELQETDIQSCNPQILEFFKRYLPEDLELKEQTLQNIKKNIHRLRFERIPGIDITSTDISSVDEYRKGNYEPLFNILMKVISKTELPIDALKSPWRSYHSQANDMVLYCAKSPDEHENEDLHVLPTDFALIDNDILIEVAAKSEHSRLLDSYRRITQYYQALSKPELLYSILNAIANVPEQDLPKVKSLMEVFIEKKDM